MFRLKTFNDKPKRGAPENLVLGAIGDYLTATRTFFFRVNNIPVYNSATKTFRSMPKFSRKGVSDFIALKNGVVYFIEAKAPKGTQSDEQISFQRDVEAQGGVYILARSLDDVLAHFQNKNR